MKRHHNICKSFFFAIRGFIVAVSEERNLKVQLLMFCFLIVFCYVFRFGPIEWAIVVLSSSMVIVAELINSVVERMMDFITTDYDENIKIIKDMSASFVLLACFFSIIVFCILLLYKFNLVFKDSSVFLGLLREMFKIT